MRRCCRAAPAGVSRGMLALPLPAVAGMILVFLLLRLLRLRRDLPWLAAFLGLPTLQCGIIAPARHAALPGALRVQPVTAAALPPLAWLAFCAEGLGRPPRLRAVPHLGAPLASLAARLGAPGLPDVLVPLVFAGYALALAVALRRAGPVLPRGKLGRAGQPRRVWAAIAAALALSAAVGLSIVLAFVAGHGAMVPAIGDIGMAVLLLGLARWP